MGRGQAALEFLMTYGWALLAVLVVFGILAYAAGGSTRFMSSVCTIEPPLICRDFSITKSGLVILGIENGANREIIYANTTIFCNNDLTLQRTNVSSVLVKNQQRFNVSYLYFSCPVSGSKYKAKLFVNYQLAGESVRHEAEGNIRAAVE
jgi:hypothetical protein